MPERQHFFHSRDGLKLFARDFGPEGSGRSTVLCLAGLTRNSRDFLPLAAKLEAGRRVLCPDYRGRGGSEYASDITTYNPICELSDALLLLDHLSIPKTVVVGTSRGGIIAMLMAQRAPERLSGAILNDVGPHLDQPGLLRIVRGLSTNPALGNWEEAVAALKEANVGFDALDPHEWLAFARRVFRDDGGRPAVDYDRNLAKAFPAADEIARNGLPDLWDAFTALKDVPAAVIRGQHSDLLSADTVAEMKRRMPSLLTVTVPDRGHVPFLDEPESLAAIDRVLSSCDAGRP